MERSRPSFWLRLACGIFLFVAELQGVARAQQPRGTGTQAAASPVVAPAPDPAPAPKVTLADFAWLAAVLRNSTESHRTLPASVK